MRWLTLILVLAIVALQYPLWFGKGSWLRVWEVDRQIAEQKSHNNALTARNASTEAEVRDLKQGYDAIEERARSELGMIKRDEVFFQVLDERNADPIHTPSTAAQPAISQPAPAAPKSAVSASPQPSSGPKKP